MPFLKPYDSVHKLISLPRWQRDYLEENKSVIKFSPLVQEMTTLPIISKRDPIIYEKFTGRKINKELQMIAEKYH